MRACATWRGLLVVLASTIGAPARAAINTDTALTPAVGQTIVRSQARFTLKGDDRTGLNRELFIFENRNTLVYGIRDGTAVFTVVPFLHKALEENSSTGGRLKREASGLGDIAVFLKQRLWRLDRPGATDRVALLGGLKMPTGSSGQRDDVGKLPRSVQRGSGSWDPFVGGVWTHQEQRYELSQDLLYQFNTEHGTFESGDEFHHNTGVWIRVWPNELPEAGAPSAFHLVGELNGVWQQHPQDHGERTGTEGGYTLYLSPGAQWVTTRSILEGSVMFPVIQDLGRNEIREGPRFVVSLLVTF